MRILVAHNFYQQPGGEDRVFAAEVAMLRKFGHEVEEFAVHNDRIDGMGRLELIRATIWNRDMHQRIVRAVRTCRTEIVHFHNTFPLLSPAVYSAAHLAGAATVHTLHNFRLLCPNALFYRDGHACESCLARPLPWPGIVHRCYRENRAATAVVAAMLTVHRCRRTWLTEVDAFITPSRFSRRKFIEGGLPAGRLWVKPNFLDPDPGVGPGSGRYAIYVGRLSEEKGVRVLLDAWNRVGAKVPLRIVGDGPLGPLVCEAAKTNNSIAWLGRQPSDQVLRLVGEAAFLVLPSACYENLPMAIVESFAKGTPVVVPHHGPMADLVAAGRTGDLFRPSDPDDLARCVLDMASNQARLSVMRAHARREYEASYTARRNHEILMDVYETAAGRRGRMRRSA